MEGALSVREYLIDMGSDMDDKASGRTPTDDQFFLLYFIMGTYFGPDLKGQPPKSVFQRRAEGLPPYTTENLSSTHMKMVELERVYYYILRKADQSVIVKLPWLQEFLHGNLSTSKKTVTLPFPQFDDLFPPDKHPHSLFKAAKKFMNSNICVHTFCTECMITYIQVKVEDKVSDIKCPDMSCKNSLEPLLWRSVIPNQLFDKWCDVLCESALLGADGVYCPNRECSELILNECGDRNLKRCVCPYCQKPFCFGCKVPWHDGYSCKESKKLMTRDENDVAFDLVYKKNKWQMCPKCRHGVERVSGCKRIRCRCGTDFCYECGKQERQYTTNRLRKSFVYVKYSMGNDISITQQEPQNHRQEDQKYAFTCEMCFKPVYMSNKEVENNNKLCTDCMIKYEEQNKGTFTCNICFEPMTIANGKFKNSNICVHPFCTDCMIRYIQVKVEEKVSDIRCPDTSCKYSLEPLSCRSIITDQLFDKCKKMMMRDENDVAFDLVYKKNKWQMCPKCRHCVERVNGCNRIRCSVLVLGIRLFRTTQKLKELMKKGDSGRSVEMTGSSA
ncbi:hypothetical protein CTI12_AA533320 [Artemisia annua]|uniref:RBR-type E3 ubiquitin transferase n=1 Tax=Artemisia annua TaxID=35608 RepID=A0A2U1L446_ARTAN|nr:hypothetical protein CTI12_AA533320 [Artemisia annua]